MKHWKSINWTNTLFLVFTPILGIVGTALLISKQAININTIYLALGYLIATGMAITCGYHRLFSHTTYKTKWPIRLFFILFGTTAFEGSVLEWCTDHRNHHRYTDTPKDPYNIKQGFWYAHIGWLITLDASKRDYSNVQDLIQDPLIRFQHKFYPYLALFIGFIVPMLIAGLWKDMWGGLIIAGALRTTIGQHATFCVNSVCHYFGKRIYSDRTTARDNWFTALFTFGEGFHNFHHQFPLDYRNGVRYFHFDPAKWVIRGLRFLNLASELKSIPQVKILQYRLAMEEKYLKSKYQTQPNHFIELVNSAYKRVMEALHKIELLEKRMMGIKRKRVHLKKAKLDLKYSLSVWRQLVKAYPQSVDLRSI